MASSAATTPMEKDSILPTATVDSQLSYSGNATEGRKSENDVNALSDSEKIDEVEVQGPNILSAKRFMPIYMGLLLSVFLISMDNTVIATAQVPIVEDLGGETLVLWLPTAFLLAQGTFTLFFGQVLQIFSSKYVYLFSLFIFELGSMICALAPNMPVVVAGRAVAGFGAAGLFMACFQIMIETTTVASRAGYMGFIGLVFSVSMIAAPSIGGALSEGVSWRWCFWINLPCAAVAAAGVVFILKSTKPLGAPLHSKVSILDNLKKLDVVGVILTGSFMVMIIIPIQDSNTEGWRSAKTLAPLCCSVALIPFMWLWFRYLGDDRALLPLKLIKDSNLIGCAFVSFCGYWNAIEFIYMIPYYYQTVRGSSPTKAGVDMLAMMITLAICSLGSGIAARKTGHYYPYMPLAAICGMIGAGLMYNLGAESSSGFRIGTQILIGASLGPLLQTPLLAVQANTKDRTMISRATAAVSVFQRLGGSLGASVAGTILFNQLPVQVMKRLPASVPYVNVDPTAIYHLPLGPMRDAYLAGLTKVIDVIFISGLPVYFLAFVGVITLVKITDIREGGEEVKKIDLLKKIFSIRRRKNDNTERA